MYGRVVLAAVVCDLLHIGHVRYLQQARALGDFLVVGVLSDEHVATYKKRPVVPVEERMEVINALRCVDIVYQRNSFDERPVVKRYGVSIRAFEPAEPYHLEAQRENRRALRRMGVQIVVIPRTPDISVTMIKRRIKNEVE